MFSVGTLTENTMAFAIAINDPAVQAAAITAVGGILAALIAAICATVIGRQIAGRRKLQSALQNAVSDIQFLLAVESAHCDRHKEFTDETFKQRIRQVARDQGLEWSGRFTPGRVRAMSLLNGD